MKNWQEFKNFFNRKFNGYTKIAIKNSVYSSATTIIEKIGAMFFVIIMARILMPELFGFYSLALSTILLFISLSGLGVGETLVVFVSKALGKNKQSTAKSYVLYLAKIKIVILSIILIIFGISSKLISQIYDKPIFLALLAGLLYILIVGIVGFVQLFFISINNFKVIFFRQFLFQVLRLILAPILVLYSLKHFSSEVSISIVILSLSFVWFLSLLFLIFFIKRVPFLKVKGKKLQKKEKKKINKFVVGLSILSLSGLFFGYLDIIMLGKFVLSNFIGYYQAAYILIGSFASLCFFSSVLLPIFSRIKGKQLERGFKKSLKIIFSISLISFIFILIFAPIIIKIIYGVNYLNSINLLRLLSLLLVSLPLITLYTSYFISIGKIKTITKLLLISILTNISLNYLFIVNLIKYGEIFAVFGVCIATIISKYFYLSGLMISRRKWRKNEFQKIPKKS